MKILVANLGTTSFKYRLFDMATEREIARGGVERIGSPESKCFVETGGAREDSTIVATDHSAAVRWCLDSLIAKKALGSVKELDAIGFKAVHAQDVSGVRFVDDRVLAAMEAYADVAPGHNPMYVRAMRLLAEKLPDIKMVAAFETGFHQTIADAEKLYAIPTEWTRKFGVRKYGFHGASHRFIATRMSELLKNSEAKIVSCHLGGSSSVCAIRACKSVATSMGMSPQSGLPNNNRVGDFDVFALPVILRGTGKTLAQVLDDLANRSGLLGLSGFNDIRDIEAAAAKHDAGAQAALDVFIASVRHYLGAYLLLLGGADAIVFTGGIGENSVRMREEVCRNLEWFGIRIDPVKNKSVKGEARFDAADSRVQLWTMPTNEEIVVARQTAEKLRG
jgi:acetate kinase